MSHRHIPALAIVALLALGTAVASAQTPQQMRMKQCNVEASARHLMGSRRQTYLRTCLQGRHVALTAQQQRMRFCNAQARAKGLGGTRRSSFMSSCLRRG